MLGLDRQMAEMEGVSAESEPCCGECAGGTAEEMRSTVQWTILMLLTAGVSDLFWWYACLHRVIGEDTTAMESSRTCVGGRNA